MVLLCIVSKLRIAELVRFIVPSGKKLDIQLQGETRELLNGSGNETIHGFAYKSITHRSVSVHTFLLAME